MLFIQWPEPTKTRSEWFGLMSDGSHTKHQNNTKTPILCLELPLSFRFGSDVSLMLPTFVGPATRQSTDAKLIQTAIQSWLSLLSPPICTSKHRCFHEPLMVFSTPHLGKTILRPPRRPCLQAISESCRRWSQ